MPDPPFPSAPFAMRLPLCSAVVFAAMLLIAGGCAQASSEGREELLSPTPAPTLDCAPESFPESLPSANVLVDSARLVSLITEYARADTMMAGSVLLTMAYDTAGLNARREVVEHSSGPLVADSIQSLVFSTVRQVEKQESDWGVRFRVDIGNDVALRVGRREFCPPIPLDRSLEEAMAGFNPPGIRYRRGRRERVLQMRAHVDASGFISTARVERGTLGGSSLERSVIQFLRQFRFQPATVDGFPVASSVQIPVPVRD